jgi:hypothetical protein
VCNRHGQSVYDCKFSPQLEIYLLSKTCLDLELESLVSSFLVRYIKNMLTELQYIITGKYIKRRGNFELFNNRDVVITS